MEMKIIESSFDSETLFEKENAIIIGVSINNSYFKEENLNKLVLWSTERYSSVFIMIPDEPMVHTLMALGYSKSKAISKVRLKTNNLVRKCNRIIDFNNLSGKVKIITWKDLDNRIYKDTLITLINLYSKNLDFRWVTRKTTSNVILANGKTPDELSIDEGAYFFLKELAFIIQSDLILKQKRVVYLYHKKTEVLENLLSGLYGIYDFYDRSKSSVGFLTAY